MVFVLFSETLHPVLTASNYKGPFSDVYHESCFDIKCLRCLTGIWIIFVAHTTPCSVISVIPHARCVVLFVTSDAIHHLLTAFKCPFSDVYLEPGLDIKGLRCLTGVVIILWRTRLPPV